MKILGALAQARFVLAMTLGLCAFSGTTFYSSNADASAARLRAIEKVIGLHERKHNKTIRKMVGVNPARTPWCGGAVAYAVKRSGGKPIKGYLGAKNWSRYGKGVSLSKAKKGDIVVIRTKRGHHVSIYKSRSKGRVTLCGGNQGDSFKCSSYRSSSVKAVRR
ncbi:MAG: TIGR02594 family protein [Nitratireductor sp.]